MIDKVAHMRHQERFKLSEQEGRVSLICGQYSRKNSLTFIEYLDDWDMI